MIIVLAVYSILHCYQIDDLRRRMAKVEGKSSRSLQARWEEQHDI